MSPAPESPSAAPSPHPKKPILNANQLALLNLEPQRRSKKKRSDGADKQKRKNASSDESGDEDSKGPAGSEHTVDDEMVLRQEDPIEAQLRQITELLIGDRDKQTREALANRREKRQVIFVLANYFVLFLSLIAISAEIQARAPEWLDSLEKQMRDVQDCASDKEALFQCVTNGDFAGLVASVTIWLTRSVATRRIFLFGFDTTQKLWTVVYESRKFHYVLCTILSPLHHSLFNLNLTRPQSLLRFAGV